MTSRQDYIYQLTGRITDKRTKKKKDGTTFYQLSVAIQDKEVSKINVFQDSCQEKVWQTIAESKYIKKEYLFDCKNFMGSYYLVNWEILKNHGIN